jgi:hypothetical protein
MAVPAGTLAQDTVPRPGQVGYTGDPSKLTVIDGRGAVPAGSQWSSGQLQVPGDNVKLDHAFVKGGIVYSGKGTLTVSNSIVEGNKDSWSVIMGDSGHLDIRDTTVRWKAGDPGPDRWGNGAIHGDSTVTVVRCDISGTPDGVQNGPGKSRFEQNYIHDMVRRGEYPNATHNDGIQSYGGPDLIIRYNRIDISGPNGLAYDGQHQNGAVFIAPSGASPSSGLQVVGNYLAGGGFILRLGAPMTGAVVTGNSFGPTTGGWGEVALDKGAAVARWSGNTKASGKALEKP